jgi:ring-1,2-phenylacetyl-CoA epoxidase subunit PaaE
MPVEFHSLRVCDVRRETDEVVSVAFEVPPHLAELYAYSPGQHLTLRRRFDDKRFDDKRFDDKPIDDKEEVELRRSYSICSGVAEHELRVAVKCVPGGRFSEWLHAELRPGMCLDVMTPAGRFTTQLDPRRQRHYLALAVGKGITPIMALLKSSLACEPNSRFTLVYGNRTTRSILFREQLADLKDRYLDRLQVVHVLSGQHQDVPLFNGRLDADHLRLLSGSLIALDSVDEVFVCAPQPTTQALRETLRDLGMDPAHIHFELFGTPHTPSSTAAVAAPVADHHLSLIARGVRTEIDLDAGTTLLEAGLAAGLDLPFSCKDGICATCRAHLRQGEVAMAANYALEPWELERGFVLTCQSRPISASIVVDYDET